MTLTFYRDYQELFAGMTGYWNLSNSGIIGTICPNIINSGTNDGTVVGSPSKAVDRFGIASNTLTFDATDDKITLPTTALNSATFGIGGWIKGAVRATGERRTMVSCMNPYSWCIVLSDTNTSNGSPNKIQFMVQNTVPDVFVANSVTTLTATETWYFVFATINDSTGVMRLFVNGAYESTATRTGSHRSYSLANSIGAQFDGTNTVYIHNSAIGEIMFFTTIPSDAVIKQLYALTSKKYLYPLFSNRRCVE